MGCPRRKAELETLQQVAPESRALGNVLLHEFRPATEGWFERHIRMWRHTSEQLTAVWGCRLAVVMAACAVSGVRRLSGRPACSVMGRVQRWRSAADQAALRHMAGGALRQWSRRRNGRPSFRLEEPFIRFAGHEWWEMFVLGGLGQSPSKYGWRTLAETLRLLSVLVFSSVCRALPF